MKLSFQKTSSFVLYLYVTIHAVFVLQTGALDNRRDNRQLVPRFVSGERTSSHLHPLFLSSQGNGRGGYTSSGRQTDSCSRRFCGRSSIRMTTAPILTPG
jgi:hypothetical protein